MVDQFQSGSSTMSSYSMASQQHFVPSPDVMLTIVFPTIIFCIGMVVAMLIGINKCKQWELDKVVEMRRTRRVIQRITARLREKNFRTIQKARHMRKRAVSAVAEPNGNQRGFKAPPVYNGRADQHYPTGNSPPPAYEDSLLDQLYYECMPEHEKKRRKSSCK